MTPLFGGRHVDDRFSGSRSRRGHCEAEMMRSGSGVAPDAEKDAFMEAGRAGRILCVSTGPDPHLLPAMDVRRSGRSASCRQVAKKENIVPARLREADSGMIMPEMAAMGSSIRAGGTWRGEGLQQGAGFPAGFHPCKALHSYKALPFERRRFTGNAYFRLYCLSRFALSGVDFLTKSG